MRAGGQVGIMHAGQADGSQGRMQGKRAGGQDGGQAVRKSRKAEKVRKRWARQADGSQAGGKKSQGGKERKKAGERAKAEKNKKIKVDVFYIKSICN